MKELIKKAFGMIITAIQNVDPNQASRAGLLFIVMTSFWATFPWVTVEQQLHNAKSAVVAYVNSEIFKWKYYPYRPPDSDHERLALAITHIDKEKARIIRAYPMLRIQEPAPKDIRIMRIRTFESELSGLGQFIERHNHEAEIYNSLVTSYVRDVMRSCAGIQYRGVEQTFPKYVEKIDSAQIAREIAQGIGCERLPDCLQY